MSRLNSLCNEDEDADAEDGMENMIGLASPCTDSGYKGDGTKGEESDGGDSPPPPPPSLPPSPKAKKTDDYDTEDCSHITVEELKRWEDLGLTLKFLTVLKRTNNPSQLRAIHSSICNPGFTLVQGPPGTGKTSTILGILNAFHIREYDRYYKMAVEVFLGEEGVRCRESKDAAPW
jgi:AAA domain